MIERRNFYRILHAQPDASMAVIRENYRLLKQKLKTHPDLTNDDWNENLLEAAYQTLSDPTKRSIYDHELLRYYHIDTLTHGGLRANTNKSGNKQTSNQSSLKNYYRILQVQPDAPAAIITASYQALIKNNPENISLLDESYRVLSNEETRKQYDIYLALLADKSDENNTQSHSTNPIVTSKNADNSERMLFLQPYQAVILHYCTFCKTPYRSQANLYGNENCLECTSPLTLLERESLKLFRRTMKRITIQGDFLFYLFWPGKPYCGFFQDLSSSGLRFWSQQPVDLQEIIKVDASNLQAIAEITHTSAERNGTSVGARFITVKFDQIRGNFISAKA
ncbi:MAG TPA: DnaJ domain-containing protein [Nitrosomonas sp.]|nr:DnaJ domain-containing protein [Nitrosomonas sp.]